MIYTVTIRTAWDAGPLKTGAAQSSSALDQINQKAEASAKRATDAYTRMYQTIDAGRTAFVASQIAAAEKAGSGIVDAAIRSGQRQAAETQKVVQAQRTADQQRLNNFQSTINAIDRAEQQRTSSAARAAQQRISEEQKTAKTVEQINAQTARNASQNEAIRARAARVIGDPGGAITGIPQVGLVNLREGRRAADELTHGLNQTHGATEQLNASQLVLGVTIGNIVAQQAQRLFSTLKDGIVSTALYASRTEELGFALESVAKANGIASAEIIGQENAIKRLNITTQDTRQILAKLVLTQLDYTKATQLATAAQDLGVIAGQSTAEELQDLVQGITTLQPRVLRNAAVFTTAEETTAKYAKTVNKTVNEITTQEKQTALMNEVLLQGARAVGTYDAAMNSASKQIRSMERLQAEATNAVGAFFQGPLKFVVAGLSELLKLIEQFPGTLLLLIAAFGAATIAMLALNATTAAFFANVIGGATAAIPALLAAMAAVVTGAEATTAALIAGTAGWAALAIAVGAVGYAIYSYITASDEAKGADTRRFNQLSLLITATKDDIETLKNSTGAVADDAKQRALLESALLRLDPVTRAHILLISDEVEKRKALSNALQDAVKNYEKERDVLLQASVASAQQSAATEAEKHVTLKYLLDRRTELEKQIETFQRLQKVSTYQTEKYVQGLVESGKTQTNYSEFIDQTNGSIKRLTDRIATLGTEITKGNPEFETQSNLLAEYARSTNKTGTEVLQFITHSKDLSLAQKELAGRIDEINAKVKEQETRYNGVAGAMLRYEEATRNLKLPEIDAGKSTENVRQTFETISKQFSDTVEGFKTKGVADPFRESVIIFSDALQKLDKQAKETFGGSGQKAYNEFIRSLPDDTQKALRLAASMDQTASSVNAITDKSKKTQTELQKLQRSFNSLTGDLKSFRERGTQEFELRFKVEDLERQKADIEALLKLRHQLGLPLDMPLPLGTEAIQASVRELGRLKSGREDLLKATEAQQAAEVELAVLIAERAIPLIDAETQAQLKYEKVLADRRIAEANLTSDLMTAVRARESALKGEREALKDTFSEYTKIRLDAVNESEAARRKLLRTQLNLEVETGGEIKIQRRLELQLRNETTTPIATISTNVAKIVALLTQPIKESTSGTGLASASSLDKFSARISATTQETLKRAIESTLGNTKIQAAVTSASTKTGVPSNLINALIAVESGGNSRAVSPGVGAEGLMQLMRPTAKQMGVKDSFNINQNVMGGAKYLAGLLKQFEDVSLALAGYNAGPGAVIKAGGRVPNFAETKEHVGKVGFLLDYLAGQSGRRIGITSAQPAPVQPQSGTSEAATAHIARLMSRAEGHPTEPTIPGPAETADIVRTTTQAAQAPAAQERDLIRYRNALDDAKSEALDLVQSIQQLDAQQAISNLTTGKTVDQIKAVVEADIKRIASTEGQAAAEAERQRLGQLTLEQLATEELLKQRVANEVKRDSAAQVQAAVLLHDNASRAVNDAEYQLKLSRLLRDANTQRDKEEGDTLDRLSVKQAYLNQLRAGDPTVRRQLQTGFAEQMVDDQTKVATQIEETQFQIAHAAEGAADRYHLAWLKAIKGVQDADEQARISMIESQVKIADATVYHEGRANAKVLEFLASQKSVTDSIADFKIGLIQAGFDQIDSAFQKLIGTGNVFKKLLVDLLSNLTKLFLSKFLSQAIGGGSTAGGGGTAGNLFSTLLGGALRPRQTGGALNVTQTGGFGGFGAGGNITSPQAAQTAALSTIFGSVTGSGGAGITAPASLTSQLAQQATISTAIHEAGHGVGAAAGTAAGAAAAPGLLASFGAAAPLLGLSLGASLGGSSRAGSIVGGVGGLIAGGIGAAFLAPGLFAATGALGSLGPVLAGLLTNPFTAVAAGALIVGALILRKNAARRRDETTRNQGMLDSLGQLNEILRQVKTDRLDGNSAIASAMQIRGQYVEAMSKLGDKKTRDIALSDVSRLDIVIAQIRGAGDQQARRQKNVARIVPEFKTGAEFYAAKGLTSIPGHFDARDDVDFKVSRGEHVAVMTPTQFNRLGGQKTFEKAGVPSVNVDRAVRKFQTGGTFSTSAHASSAPTPSIQFGAGLINTSMYGPGLVGGSSPTLVGGGTTVGTWSGGIPRAPQLQFGRGVAIAQTGQQQTLPTTGTFSSSTGSAQVSGSHSEGSDGEKKDLVIEIDELVIYQDSGKVIARGVKSPEGYNAIVRITKQINLDRRD